VGKISHVVGRFFRHIRRFFPPYGGEPAQAQVARLEALAEKAYDEMYETRFPTGCYADLKDHFVDAIGVAERAGLTADAERLRKRLNHCKKVYRSQFSHF
jgi:hypothetical protein